MRIEIHDIFKIHKEFSEKQCAKYEQFYFFAALFNEDVQESFFLSRADL